MISFESWLANVKVIVQAFADGAFQAEAWRGPTPTSFGSPDEMMCVYFDDVLVPEFITEHAAAIGARSAAAGEHLTAKLEGFAWPIQGDFIAVEPLLVMPEWDEIQTIADLFLQSLPSQER